MIKLQETNQRLFLLRKLYAEFGQVTLLCNTPPQKKMYLRRRAVNWILAIPSY